MHRPPFVLSILLLFQLSVVSSRPQASAPSTESLTGSSSLSPTQSLGQAAIITTTAPATVSHSAESITTSVSVTNADLIIYTDLAANTTVTLTRSTTPYIPDPSVGVPPPFSAIATMTQSSHAPDQQPTRSVDTFVQASYTGAASTRNSDLSLARSGLLALAPLFLLL